METIGTETSKTVFYVSGNDAFIKKRLAGIENIRDTDTKDVRIVYTDRVNLANKEFIVSLAKKYHFVTPVELIKNKKSLNHRIFSKIRTLHVQSPDAKVVLLGDRCSSGEFVDLENQGYFSYATSIEDESIQHNEDKTYMEECCDIPNGGQLHILIDYENVGMQGLSGTQYLCSNDSVTLFYSDSSSHIEKEVIEAMEHNTASFEAIKLKTVNKNGLDFYIAVRVGEIVKEKPDTKIMIITGDNGFKAIKEYCQYYSELQYPIAISKDIESGIVSIDGNTKRRKIILEKRKRLSIEAEFAAYSEREYFKRKIAKRFSGTEFEKVSSKIVEIVQNTNSPRQRYLSSLKLFGKKNGCIIYKIVRDMR